MWHRPQALTAERHLRIDVTVRPGHASPGKNHDDVPSRISDGKNRRVA